MIPSRIKLSLPIFAIGYQVCNLSWRGNLWGNPISQFLMGVPLQVCCCLIEIGYKLFINYLAENIMLMEYHIRLMFYLRCTIRGTLVQLIMRIFIKCDVKCQMI